MNHNLYKHLYFKYLENHYVNNHQYYSIAKKIIINMIRILNMLFYSSTLLELYRKHLNAINKNKL